MLRYLAIIMLFISFSVQSAEYVYVTDQLYLGLHTKPDSNSKRIKLMKSGVKLEVLDKKGRYKKVKTVSGAVGWAKAHLLLSEPTSALKLEKLQKKYQELEKKTYVAGVMQKEFAQLEEKLILSQTKTLELKETIEQLKKENQAQLIKKQSQASVVNIKSPTTVIIIAGLTILAFVIIFLIGRMSYERKVRGEFNGYRIW